MQIFWVLLEQEWSTNIDPIGIFHLIPSNFTPIRYTSFQNTEKNMTIPYQPITKEDAARTMKVSKRTIENWIADGTLLAPTAIGRRVYWHPDKFYSWLDQRLNYQRQPCSVEGQAKSSRGRPRAALKASAS